MIPTIFQRYHYAGIIRHNVSLHDIRPFNPQFTAFFNAVNRIDFVLQSRQQFADRTETVKNSVIGGYYRRAFCRTVCFQNTNAKPLHPHITGISFNGFCAAKHKADIMKVKRMGNFTVTAEESICAEHNRCADFIYNFGHNAVMQRGGI